MSKLENTIKDGEKDIDWDSYAGLVPRATFFANAQATDNHIIRKLIKKVDNGAGVIFMPNGRMAPMVVPGSADEYELDQMSDHLEDILPDDSAYKPIEWTEENMRRIKKLQAEQQRIEHPDSRDYFDPVAYAKEKEKEEQDAKLAELKLLGLEKLKRSSKKKTTIERVYSMFRGLFSDRSWNNEKASLIMFHTILGALLVNTRYLKGTNEVDPRVNLIWVQSSTSGKTQARIFIRDLAKALKLKFKEVSEFTDAAMIGKIDMPPGRPSSKKPIIPTITKGFLNEADIIYMDDADDFIKGKTSGTQYSKMARKHFRDALNPIGNNTVGKDLRNGSIYFQPHCSVIGTSYYFDGAGMTEDRTGFWQRFLCFAREISTNEKKKNLAELKRRQPQSQAAYLTLRKNREDQFKKLVKILNTIDRTPRVFFVEPDAVDFIYDIQLEILDYVGNLGQSKQFLEDFLERITNNMYAIALHSAAVDSRDSISLADAQYSVRLVYPLFRQAISWFEGSHDVRKYNKKSRFKTQARKAIHNAFDIIVKAGHIDDGWVDKSLVLEKMMEIQSKSRDSIYKYWFPEVKDDFEEKRGAFPNQQKVYWRRVQLWDGTKLVTRKKKSTKTTKAKKVVKK